MIVDAEYERPEKLLLAVQEFDLIHTLPVEPLNVIQVVRKPISVAQMVIIPIAHLTIQLYRELFIWMLTEIVPDVDKFPRVVVIGVVFGKWIKPRT